MVERDFVDQVILALDDAFQRLDGPAGDVLVYRGGPALPRDGFMRGYVSSSLDREVAEAIATERGDLWEITAGAGSRALLLPAVDATHTPAQAEVLIDRNQRFILHSVTARGEHGRLLKVQLQP